jgi:hypothetical protein
VMLTPDDRSRHHHLRFKGTVLNFVVQYETRIRGRWFPVVRYDTRHGFAHRDVLDSKGNARKTPVFARNYNEALTFAEYDIRSNWILYKQRFMEGFDDEQTD